jgi:protease IV
MSRNKTLIRSLAFVAVTIGLATTTRAQLPYTATNAPTRGLDIPTGPLVGDADATAIELNPGQLGMVEHTSFTALVNGQQAASLRAGTGGGLFLALPLGFATYGVSFQSVVQPGKGSTVNKLQNALAFRSSTTFGIGMAWNHFYADSLSYLDDLDTFDVGVTIRPWRQIGLGVAVRDLNAPKTSNGRKLSRVYASELAYRPLGTDGLELAAGARIGEDRSSPAYHGRFSYRLRAGLRLMGQFDRLQAEIISNSVDETRFTAGLAIDWDHMGISLFGLSSHHAVPAGLDKGMAGTEGDNYGMSMALRLSADRRAPISDSARVEQHDLSRVKTDAQFIALTTKLRRSLSDPHVAGVLFDIDDVGIGLARIEELRDLIAAHRARGKKTFAYFTSASTRTYFLASACDRVIMHRAGSLYLNGLASTVTFFKNALDRIGIGVDLVRIAEYKGAMEPFVRTDFSEAVAKNADDMVGHAFERILAAILKGRSSHKLTEAGLRTLVDRGAFTAAEAKTAGLVDDVQNRTEITTLDEHPVVDPSSAPTHRDAWAAARIAVIMIEGPIVDGETSALPFADDLSTGSRTVVKNLDKARDDSGVRAVVLRVNSPGGSVTASDEIARAVSRVRAAGKPVIVSMGDVAASGGYYVSAPADLIFAQPLSTTGSIGIYTAHIDFAALAGTLGLDFQTIKRGEKADHMSPHRPWDDDDRAQAQSHLQSLYELFLDTVVDGRKAHKLDRGGVDKVGRGLVLDGERAITEKLVDRAGGFWAAIDESARRTGIPLRPDGIPELEIYPNGERPTFAVSVSPASIQVSIGGDAVPQIDSPLSVLIEQAKQRIGADTLNWVAGLLSAPNGSGLALSPFLFRVD